MSHHSPEVDKQLTDALNEKFEKLLDERLGKTGDHPRGRLTPTDEGGIKFAVGSKNGAVVIDFGTPVAWVGFSPKEARDIAASLVKHADHLEGKPTAPPPPAIPPPPPSPPTLDDFQYPWSAPADGKTQP